MKTKCISPQIKVDLSFVLINALNYSFNIFFLNLLSGQFLFGYRCNTHVQVVK